MKKDVIYIDIEDDITSIIGKVKAAGAKIVALVPPKRLGVLQSVVNLKLLQRAANNADKRVVMITSDRSLTALAAGVSMPVAKNLQTRPEIPAIDALEIDDNDVINGEDLPVGELAATAVTAAAAPDSSVNAAAKAAGDSLDDPIKPAAAIAKSKSNRVKIPNFDSFRKRIFLIGGGVALLLIFLVWAIFFAPTATVTITAKTSVVNINESLTLDPSSTTDVSADIIKPLVQQTKKTDSKEFNATGKKDVGEKASGSVEVTNCEYPLGFTIPAGTTFRSASSLDFTNPSAVSLPGYTQQSQCAETKRSVAVNAEEFGPEYNIEPQTYQISGTGENIIAEGGQMSGGTKKTVTVVSEDDVDKAKTDLAEDETDASAVQAELADKFPDDTVIINESFKGDQADPSVSPKVGEEASKATLTVETTYTLVGISRADIQAYLNDKLNKTIEGQTDRQVYNTGDNDLRFSQFQSLKDNNYTLNLTTNGAIGPKIDTEQLAEDLAGKRFGEIEQQVMSIEGVDDVKVDFSPFWVNQAPKAEKIQIKFSVLNEGS